MVADQTTPAPAESVGPRRPAAWRRWLFGPIVAAARAIGRMWLRSLEFRVAATTLVVTGITVLVIGVFLIQEVAGGVLNAKRHAAVGQARFGYETASSVLSSTDAGAPNALPFAVQQLTQQLTASGQSAGLFTIAIQTDAAPVTSGTTAGQPQIPASLRTVVRAGHRAVQYAPVPNAGTKTTVPGLIVGEPVTARTGLFELYYLFPLSAEQKTIRIMQNTVAVAGLALVVLVVAIAMLVTRQVVRPVRVVAQTAGRLAAGDLSQRIQVHGADDIARLGGSFNDMADSLQRQIRRLEDLSRLQRRFVSDVSHELRTPLTTIRMASEMLHSSRDDFPPALSRSAELLNAELDRFEALLADLLEISRHDAGVANLESESVDLCAVVGGSVEAARLLADRQGSELVVISPGVPVAVDMDSRRVERIMRNLLANAIDHGAGRPVEITIAADDEAVAVTVRDHGVGLREGEAALVFNRFWRGDPSRSRLTGGTGLGLAISLEDARLHDGWLQAWGLRGEGAQFRLTLPRHAGHTLVSSPLPLVPDERSDDHGAERLDEHATGGEVPA